ncbi:MAG: ParB/RepB/Spo0J family partition protein [Verrucomicrobiae bacterium]|nr:ParB/RepB/Spo0J family partition protein [Verrucomicrobiae bacterium]
MAKFALGKGLDALITGGIARKAEPATVTPAFPQTAPVPQPVLPSKDNVVRVSIEQVHRSPFQPRTSFQQEPLQELVDSISQRGVVQPLLVRKSATGYELIAGERRLRASQAAGLKEVPVIVREAGDQEVLELALIENLQRENLNAIEEARGYNELISRFSLKQEDVAQKVGKSRAAVANALRLLALPEDVQGWVAKGQLSVGHAKVILGLTIKEEQWLMAERCIKQGLTVRQIERLVETAKQTGRVPSTKKHRFNNAPHIEAIEEGLRQKLGTKVHIIRGRKKGRIEIDFYGEDDLSRLITVLGFDKF